jgi:C-terminal processing protease CtpA/Prc
MRRTVAVLVAAAVAGGALASAQTVQKDRQRGRAMLREVRNLLQRYYRDPTFGGRSLDVRFAEAERAMDAARSERETYAVVARTLDALDDSHTFFLPPGEGAADFGWTPRMIGDRCFVVEVKAGSDAARQGLAVGDEILMLEGAPPERTTLWPRLQMLRLVPSLPVAHLTVRGASGEVRELALQSKRADERDGRTLTMREFLDVLSHSRAERERGLFADAGDVLVWRLAAFDKDGKSIVEGVQRARRARALVLDLRGNSGGDAGALRRLIGAFFGPPGPVVVGWLESRGRLRPLSAPLWPRGRGFSGPLVVVVDSDSASAAEVFARTVQLRRRGTVVGDRTGGAVMLSRTHVRMQARENRLLGYAVSITEADVILPDGSSLEKTGLTPDITVLPTGDDLRAHADPALARAVELAGTALTSEAAARLLAAAPPPRD